jgi:hypothetical protein
MLPPEEECQLHSPTWVRGGSATSYFDSVPVTLVQALEETRASQHLGMVEAHVQVLVGWLEIGDDVIATKPPDAIERRGVGFALLMFAAELAGALGSDRYGPAIPAELRSRACEAVSLATLRAGACLGALASEYWTSVA